MTTFRAGLLLALAGCATSPDEPNAHLPAAMSLVATAQGIVAGRTIDCSLHFTIDLERDGARDGTWGGEASRKSLLPDGSGIAFLADASSQVRVEGVPGNGVRLVSYREGRPIAADGQSRFWDGILALEGTYASGNRTISGAWTCHPMDTRGDDLGSVDGTWIARPR
jgi:hypothetical protein